MELKMKKNVRTLIKGALLTIMIFSLALLAGNGKTSQSMAAGSYNETALFLAGKPLPKNSALKKYTRNAFYRSYSRQLKKSWNRFQKPNLDKMKKWWKTHGPSSTPDDVLYPFSGPDIMNVLAFFPDKESYTMFGLEQPGILPNPYAMNSRQVHRGLRGVKSSLNTILRVNFFRTKGMAKQLGNKSFNGIAGLMFIFLSLNDYTIVDARRVAINARGRLVPGIKSDHRIRWQSPPASRRIPGIEISFRKGSGKVQKVRYFMLNVIDYALKKHSPHFLPYIKKNGPYATFIKSASYLMHNDKIKFTKIRAAVLSSSRYIVQDDSGIPLRYLPSSRWNVKFHGVYDRPIPLFKNRAQKDLRRAMKKKSTGILPFSYGYDYRKNESNLITAERK